jgi:hypothetical protein
VEPLSHLPRNPGDLIAVDLYGPLPTDRGGVKHLFVCLEVFTKHVTLYPLRAATTKGCLRKLTEHYIEKVIKPKVILSDHGSQFTSHIWKDTLESLGITIKYSPIRHPESNPAERVMKELGKFFKIYCCKTHKKWPEFINHIQNWLNQSVSQSTGYKPTELLPTETKGKLFIEIMKKLPDNPPEEDLLTKVLKAYERAKDRAEKRRNKKTKGKFEWKPQIDDLVLVKSQPISDANKGIIRKFQQTYEGPFLVGEIVNPGLFKIQNKLGESKGLFHISHLKPYKVPDSWIEYSKRLVGEQ